MHSGAGGIALTRLRRVADSMGIHMQAATSETISVQRVASSLLPLDTLGGTIKAHMHQRRSSALN